MKRIFLILFLLLVSGSCADVHSQFVERSEELQLDLNGTQAYFGSGTSFYDFNDDGLDDLTLGSTDFGVQVFLNNGDGFTEQFFFSELEGELKHPTWVDYDNDGDNDFFVTRMFAKPYLFRNDGELVFVDVSETLPCPSDDAVSSCCSWGDYDKDSFLDLYVANYSFLLGASSWLFHNNGDGTFTELATELNIENGIVPAFQCLWFDYNLDSDLDLMILNDKGFGCKLYDNDGFGAYTEIADQVGFNIIRDCMGLTASDFEHDGDFDFFITTNTGNVLLRNDDGIFTDVAPEMNADAYCTTWSGLFIDTDNGMYEDIYAISTSTCSGYKNPFHINDEGVGFTYDHQMFDETNEVPAFSASKGDWNNDGKYDVVVLNGTAELRFWENQNVAGNWIKVDVEGTVSNRDGVGTIIRCYVGDELLMRAIVCGDNYMSQDSQHNIIGIGAATSVDSISVTWPSGWTDFYFDIAANSTLTFSEGETFVATLPPTIVTLCPGEITILDAGTGSAYIWENGETSNAISIDYSGIYEVHIVNAIGLVATRVFVVNDWIAPSIDPVRTLPNCYGEASGALELPIDLNEILTITWSDNSVGSFHENLYAGEYACNIQWNTGCISSHTFDLTQPDSISIATSLDTLCEGEMASPDFFITGGTGDYYFDWNTQNPDSLLAGEHVVLISDENTCMTNYSFYIESFPEIEFSYNYATPCFGESTEIFYTQNENYQYDFADQNPLEMNAGEFDLVITDQQNCIDTFPLEVISYDEINFYYEYEIPCYEEATNLVYTAIGGSGVYAFEFGGFSSSEIYAGDYEVLITDDAGCSSTTPYTVIENPALYVVSEVQNLTDEANGLIALDVDGGTPPYTFHWSDETSESQIVIMEAGAYNCTIADAIGCELTMSFDVINLTLEEIQNQCSIFPVPFANELNIQSKFPAHFRLYDTIGNLILASQKNESHYLLQLDFLPQGIYFIQIGNTYFKITK